MEFRIKHVNYFKPLKIIYGTTIISPMSHRDILITRKNKCYIKIYFIDIYTKYKFSIKYSAEFGGLSQF